MRFQLFQVIFFLFFIFIEFLTAPLSLAAVQLREEVLYGTYFRDGAGANPYGWSFNNIAKHMAQDAILHWHNYQSVSKASYIEITLKKPASSSVSWVSERFQLKSSQFLIVDAKVAVRNVIPGKETWYRAAVTLQFFGSLGKYVGHDDVVRIAGTHDYQDFRRIVVPPEDATHARVLFSMVGAVGTARLSNVRVAGKHINGDQEGQRSELTNIMPKPWKVRAFDNVLTGRSIYLNTTADATVSNLLLNAGFRVLTKRFGSEKVKNGTIQYTGGSRQIKISLQHLRQGSNFGLLTKEENVIVRNELGQEGYLLLIDEDTKSNVNISIFANTDWGLFYGIQTLVQIIKKNSDGNFILRKHMIIDKPAIPVRGIGTGMQSFAYMEKLAGLKINEIQISGAPGVWADWKTGTDENLREKVAKLSKQSKDNFLNATVLIWPGGYGDVFRWTRAEDRQRIVEKLKLYRDASFSRGVIVCASDYARVGRGNGIVAQEDISEGITLDLAHKDLVEHVYHELTNEGNTFGIGLFPYYYLGAREYDESELGYLKSLSGLPGNIEIIYGGRVSVSDLKLFNSVIGRKALVRLPGPQEANGRVFDSRKVLESTFEAGVESYMSGVVIETSDNDSALEEIADFLWNFGRSLN